MAHRNTVKSATLKQIKELNGQNAYKADPAIYLDFLLKRNDICQNSEKIYAIGKILENEDLSSAERTVLENHRRLLRARSIELRQPFDVAHALATEVSPGCALREPVSDRWLLRDEFVEAAERAFGEVWRSISSSSI